MRDDDVFVALRTQNEFDAIVADTLADVAAHVAEWYATELVPVSA